MENENRYSKEQYGEDFVIDQPMLVEKSMIGINVLQILKQHYGD
jgi:hypothetical protein